MPPRRRPRAHNGGANPPPSSVPRVCRFHNEGSCRYGKNCKFLHNAAQGSSPNGRLVETAANSNGTTFMAPSLGIPAEAVERISVPLANAEPAIRNDGDRIAHRDGSGSSRPVSHCADGVEEQSRDEATLEQAGRAWASAAHGPAATPSKKPCFAFQKKGWCRKGVVCQYSHDPRVLQSGNQIQINVHEARIRAEQAERATRERIRREEEERLERERLERQRLEAERLELERLERERLQAERLERERAEAERVALERAAAAARRAEERERQRKEKADKLLREQEAKRRQDAKVTLQFVVQGSNFVTFGPGLDVKRVVPGFDLCKVTIRNLPPDATEKEVTNIFKEQGLDETMFKLLEFKREGGAKVARLLTRNEEAEAMAAGLEGLEFRDSTLTFEVEENTAWGSMKSSATGTDANTLTFFWNAPSVVMVATYDTVDEARRKARELNRHRFEGRTITAILNPRPNGPASRYWVEASVKIGNLPPGTIPEDVEALAGTLNVRPIKSGNYDSAIFMEQLKVYLRFNGCTMDSFQTRELQPGTGQMKGTARFQSQETLSRAADRLTLGGLNWPKIRVAEQHQYSITIPIAQYRAQKAQWDSMTETARGKKAYVRVNERRNGRVFVNVEGSDEKQVGELKVRAESLVAGERLGAEHWHNTYASHLGKALFDRVKDETSVLVTVDTRFQALRLFGEANSVAEAKVLIAQDVERLKLMEFTISVDRQSVRFFVATGLPILKEALGEDNVSLDVSSRQCSLKLRGGDEAIKHAQKLVEEAVIASRAGLKIPTQEEGNEGPPCPICYDTPSHPEILSCGHSCCEPCLRHYISSAATSGIFPLVCMGNEATCNTPISVPIIHRYLTQQRFTMLVDAVFSAYIQSNSRKFKYCTTPDCTQIYQCDTGKQFHQCPACFSRICSSCNEEAHEGMTCEERRVQSDPAEQDRLNNQWAQTNNVKRCPTCQVMTEKTEGCNHMTCRCGAHWCWVCGGVFDARSIYTHMQDSHGGIYGAPQPVPNLAPQPGFDAQARRNREAAERLVEQREQERRRREREAEPTANDDWMQGLNIRRCPSCNALTEKAGGYDHMTCHCGAHWCWVCSGLFTAATIYPHLMAAHGGMGFARTATAAADVQPLGETIQEYHRRIAARTDQARAERRVRVAEMTTNDDGMRGPNSKRCPSCNTLTHKVGGYDITCRCGAHWCWVCSRLFTTAALYAHLAVAHVGVGFARTAPAAAANVQPPGETLDEYLRRRATHVEQARTDLTRRREAVQREQAQQRAFADMAAARRERERHIEEQVAAAMRRDAEKNDSWCAIM